MSKLLDLGLSPRRPQGGGWLGEVRRQAAGQQGLGKRKTGRETSEEPQLHLILELEGEVARWRRRTMLMVSVLFHIFVIAFLLLEPKLFRRGAEMLGLLAENEPRPQPTFLYLPPDVQKRLKPPNTNIFSDKNREAQGKSPVIDPNGIRMPYLPGNSKLPEVAGGGKPAPPPAPPPQAEQSSGPPSPKPGGEKQTETAENKPHLLDVPDAPQDGSGGSRIQIPVATPGEAIQQSLQAAARGRASGAGAGPGDSAGQFQNLNPNFSTVGPVILSDTEGVDFGPYLARVVYAVKRNWYAVIPESARLGQKGRVAIVFEILRDGSVPEIRLVSSSGAESLDRAALSGIHASVPFPPLPSEFNGQHLVLEFFFLYNLGYGN